MTSNTLKISLPSPEDTRVKVNIKYPVTHNKKIDGYILCLVDSLKKFAQTKLVSQVKKYSASTVFSLVATYRIVNESDEIFSFWFDVFVCRGEEKSRIRRIALNFDRKKGRVIFPPCRRSHYIPHTHGQTMSEYGRMYADFEKKAKKHFKRKNTVITPRGLYATYDSGILAPHAVGAISLPLIQKE